MKTIIEYFDINKEQFRDECLKILKNSTLSTDKVLSSWIEDNTIRYTGQPENIFFSSENPFDKKISCYAEKSIPFDCLRIIEHFIYETEHNKDVPPDMFQYFRRDILPFVSNRNEFVKFKKKKEITIFSDVEDDIINQICSMSTSDYMVGETRFKPRDWERDFFAKRLVDEFFNPRKVAYECLNIRDKTVIYGNHCDYQNGFMYPEFVIINQIDGIPGYDHEKIISLNTK